MNTVKNRTKSEKLESDIEALLFFNADPLKISELSKILNSPESKVRESLVNLKNNLINRGIRLVENDDRFALATSSESSQIIEKIKRDNLTKDLSKSALETLAIVTYRGPIKRSEIDYIRGVNSQFILRLLLIRGLIEKATNPEDERGYLYKASFDLLNLLGIGSIKDLPRFREVNLEIDNFMKSNEENEK